MKKHMEAIIIVLTFLSLALFECGIFMSVFWTSGGIWGDFYMEYTKTGTIAIPLMMLFIPAGVIIVFLVRIVFCIKRKYNMIYFCFNCVCALLGMGMGIGLFLTRPYDRYRDPAFFAGVQLMNHLIETFDWMRVPIP